ncbi:autotransporter adhesin [Actinobacillus equuli]|nr:autotransporter adhesin [Actinobacillus equuli]
MAAGRITATSTDAINGSQLYVVANNLTDAINVANNTANTANATVNRGWNITTSKSAGEAKDISVSNVKMGDTVTIDAGKILILRKKVQQFRLQPAINRHLLRQLLVIRA